MHRIRVIPLLVTVLSLTAVPLAQNQSGPAAPAPAPTVPVADDVRADRLKAEALKDVDGLKVFTQQMVDSIFSFAELGFQEVETNRYLIDVLKKNGFSVPGA